ncbi:MAG: hypothetical protein PSN34_03605, partial [Urechidicola sp.]|nr:hypothetical protein [Urechidicola sp.]
MLKALTYTFRKSAFTKTQSFVLDETQIKIFNEVKMLIDTFSYNKIKSIAMVQTPTKIAQNLHQCTISTNNKKIVLRNYTYRGFANLESQNDEYLKFIIELHQKTKSKNIQFKKGIKKQVYLAMLMFLILMTGLMAVISFTLYDKNKITEMLISSVAVIVFIF